MSAKILDVSSLTIHIPVLSDEASLRRQFADRTCGNNDALDEVYALLSPETGCPIILRMALIETESLVGSSSQEIISSSCDAVNASVHSLAKPSLAQIGALACLFREEEGVKRVVPIIRDENTECLLWERANWPSAKQPVFRFHRKDPVHGAVWVMLPFAFPELKQ